MKRAPSDTQRTMTKGERDDLVRLVKQRERVAKTAAEQRSSALLAEFEQQIADTHPFDKNDVWRAAVEAASVAAKEANQRIYEEAAKLGIPEEFRPSLAFSWNRRGEAEFKERRDELRRVAKAEIEAIEKLARVEIEAKSVEAQTHIIAHGLQSEAAVQFLNSMPPIDALMPSLDMEKIQQKLIERARNKPGYHGPRLIDS